MSWRALYTQFGPPDAEPIPHRLSKFRIQCHRELGKISLAWPALRYRTELSKGSEPSRFILYPSPPSIPVKLNPNGRQDPAKLDLDNQQA